MHVLFSEVFLPNTRNLTHNSAVCLCCCGLLQLATDERRVHRATMLLRATMSCKSWPLYSTGSLLQYLRWETQVSEITTRSGDYRTWYGSPVWGHAPHFSPLSIYFLIFFPFYFFLSFIGFTYFLLLLTPSLSTRIVPLRCQAGGRRRRPNLGLFCFVL